jgi:flagellar operon protein
VNPLDALRGLDALAPVQPTSPARPSGQRPTGFGETLDALLDPRSLPGSSQADEVPADVRLSRHASQRLQSRELSFDARDEAILAKAVDDLAERGAKKALVLTGDRAWIVGVPKRTVITVLSRDEALGQVFTDLDATYVAPDR